MQESTEELIAKITKLVNLAEHPTASPGEAANAAAMAQALLMRHNLDMAEIRKAQGNGDKAEIIITPYKFYGGGATRWRRDLIETISSVNLCRYIGIMRDATKGNIVGQEHNIKVVAYLTTMLTREIGRLARKTWKELGTETQVKYKMNSWLTSFCIGATRTVQRRLIEENKQAEATSQATTALVVTNKEQIKEWVSENLQIKDMTPRHHKVYATPFQSGKIAGEGIAIKPGIEGSREGSLIG